MPNRRVISLTALSAVVALSLFSLAAEPVYKAGTLQGVSKAYKDITISFVRPGIVNKIYVKEGDPVKDGQVLAQQDDQEEQAAKNIDEEKATDDTQIQAETAVRNQKKHDFEKMRDLKSGTVGIAELESAELEVTVAEARIKLALSEHKQNGLKLIQTQTAIDKLKTVCHDEGVVAQTFIKEHEAAENGNMKLLRIVQVDPLLIEVPVPIPEARKLSLSDTATITFNGGKENRTGKVTYIAPVGDAASGTILVKLEVPNPGPKPLQPGEIVQAKFNQAVVAK